VLICSYRRVHNLGQILQSLCHQTFEKSFEVVIWNNDIEAQVELQDAVKPFRSHLPLTIIHSERNFYCIVRLAMPHLMRSDLLMICDDDVIPTSDYLKTFTDGLEAAGERSVICARGHIFEPHYLDLEQPDRAWQLQQDLVFADESAPPCKVHFMHADNSLIPRAALQELASLPLPRPEFVLVDDYWMSMALSHRLNWTLWKIKADHALTFDRSSDLPGVALYLNGRVKEQRIDFYVHHMLQDWPPGCHGRFQGDPIDTP
jgi:hypothetical protein